MDFMVSGHNGGSIREGNMASQIIRATTPTIEFAFKTVSVSNISAAILTIKQGGVVLIEKALSEATIGEKSLSWTLTQEECLTLNNGKATIMLNWLTADGTRGASRENSAEVIPNHITEVI